MFAFVVRSLPYAELRGFAQGWKVLGGEGSPIELTLAVAADTTERLPLLLY